MSNGGECGRGEKPDHGARRAGGVIGVLYTHVQGGPLCGVVSEQEGSEGAKSRRHRGEGRSRQRKCVCKGPGGEHGQCV